MTWLGPVCAAWFLGNLLGAGLAVLLALAGGPRARLLYGLEQHGHRSVCWPWACRPSLEQREIHARLLVYVVDRRRGSCAHCAADPALAAARQLQF